MESARKIELQVPEDLAYLIANVRRAAVARIDEAFPPVDDSSEDVLRTRIEQLVDEYITQTFTLASPNLTINGLPIDASHFLSPSSSSSATQNSLTTALTPEEVYEPFDARKRARVEALTAEEEDLLRDIARLKKSVPGAVAAAWADAARKGVKDDEEALDKVNRGVAARFAKGGDNTTTATAADAVSSGDNPLVTGDVGNTHGNGNKNGNSNENGNENDAGEKKTKKKKSTTLVIEPLERQEALEAGFGNAVRGLGRLKREMPAVVARMEKARKAGEYVVTER